VSDPALGQMLAAVAAATDGTKHPRHVQVKLENSLSVCRSHAEVFSAIQVYRFCEMC
jgi:hypothetical protein